MTLPCASGLSALLQRFAPARSALLAFRGLSARSAPAESPEDSALRPLRNRLLYRSKQRGWLELDLLVGAWAEQHLPSMNSAMLHEFSQVLEQENPELYKWLTRQEVAPANMEANRAFQALRQHVAEDLESHSHPATHAAPGKEWVRGWSDTASKQPS